MGEHNVARQAERQVAALGEYDSLWFEGAWRTSTGMAESASRLATGLIKQGVAPGDRVVVLMANCPEVITTYTALWRAGAVVTPLIFLVSEKELRAAVIDSGAVAVVTTPEFLPKVNAAIAGVPAVRFVVVAGAVPDGLAVPVPLVDHAELASADEGTIVDRADDDLAALLYTGGTTGRSKGVPLTHANLFWCGSSAREASQGDDDMRTTLVPLPLAHAYGLLVTCIGTHQTEPHQTILMRWFDPAGWVALAERHKVARSALVPSMIQMLLGQPLEDVDLSALRAVSSGAAPLAAEVRDEFETRVPGVTVYEGYGCTESASIISSTPIGQRKKGSVGKPVPGCAVAILDDVGTELAPGVDGEICVKSPGVMSGYWHVPDSTAVVDGWLHTGDIGHVDDDGYLYVVDRKKDLIIRGGFNVYPRDVEDVLLAHPAVAMAGVVGKPDSRLGEEVVAFVSLRPGAVATVEELTTHAKERLAATKYPREIRIVDQVPLTSVGKLDRKRLRDVVRAGDR